MRNSKLKARIVRTRDAFLFHKTILATLDAYIVRIRGNRVFSRGCVFDVSGPLVSPWIKGLLFYGFYEKPEVKFVRKYLRPGTDVVELGASLGVVSSHIAKKLGKSAKLISIEADPRLLDSIRTNISLNEPNAEVAILNLAVSYDSSNESQVHFRFGDSNLSGGLLRSGQKAVETASTAVPGATLREICRNNRIGQFILVSDIEGAEAGFIEAEEELLRRCPLLIIELHNSIHNGKDLSVSDLRNLLIRGHGYQLIDQRNAVHVFARENYFFK